MLKVSELKGYKSLRAFNAFHTLMLGVKMLPLYVELSYEEFSNKIFEMPNKDKLILIQQAASLVELSQDEIEALAYFCTDKNGIPYNKTNINNLKPDELIEIIVSVCMEIGKIKIDLINEIEKKK